MANIASGYLWIGLAGKDAATELTTAIGESGLFSYGGDVDIEIGDDGINVGFSSAWTGEGSWDWIDTQLSESSQLTPSCQAALLNSEISGYTYEHGCQHRDRVSKAPGEKKLARQQANIPDNILIALKLSKAFDLSPGEQMIVSGGTVTLASKEASGEKQDDTVYKFLISCAYSLEITLCIKDSSLYTDATEYSVVEIDLEDWDPDDDEEYDETSMFKEIVDDMVADIEEIYL